MSVQYTTPLAQQYAPVALSTCHKVLKFLHDLQTKSKTAQSSTNDQQTIELVEKFIVQLEKPSCQISIISRCYYNLALIFNNKGQPKEAASLAKSAFKLYSMNCEDVQRQFSAAQLYINSLLQSTNNRMCTQIPPQQGKLPQMIPKSPNVVLSVVIENVNSIIDVIKVYSKRIEKLQTLFQNNDNKDNVSNIDDYYFNHLYYSYFLTQLWSILAKVLTLTSELSAMNYFTHDVTTHVNDANNDTNGTYHYNLQTQQPPFLSSVLTNNHSLLSAPHIDTTYPISYINDGEFDVQCDKTIANDNNNNNNNDNKKINFFNQTTTTNSLHYSIISLFTTVLMLLSEHNPFSINIITTLAPSLSPLFSTQHSSPSKPHSPPQNNIISIHRILLSLNQAQLPAFIFTIIIAIAADLLYDPFLLYLQASHTHFLSNHTTTKDTNITYTIESLYKKFDNTKDEQFYHNVYPVHFPSCENPATSTTLFTSTTLSLVSSIHFTLLESLTVSLLPAIEMVKLQRTVGIGEVELRTFLFNIILLFISKTTFPIADLSVILDTLIDTLIDQDGNNNDDNDEHEGQVGKKVQPTKKSTRVAVTTKDPKVNLTTSKNITHLNIITVLFQPTTTQLLLLPFYSHDFFGTNNINSNSKGTKSVKNLKIQSTKLDSNQVYPSFHHFYQYFISQAVALSNSIITTLSSYPNYLPSQLLSVSGQFFQPLLSTTHQIPSQMPNITRTNPLEGDVTPINDNCNTNTNTNPLFVHTNLMFTATQIYTLINTHPFKPLGELIYIDQVEKNNINLIKMNQIQAQNNLNPLHNPIQWLPWQWIIQYAINSIIIGQRGNCGIDSFVILGRRIMTKLLAKVSFLNDFFSLETTTSSAKEIQSNNSTSLISTPTLIISNHSDLYLSYSILSKLFDLLKLHNSGADVNNKAVKLVPFQRILTTNIHTTMIKISLTLLSHQIYQIPIINPLELESFPMSLDICNTFEGLDMITLSYQSLLKGTKESISSLVTLLSSLQAEKTVCGFPRDVFALNESKDEKSTSKNKKDNNVDSALTTALNITLDTICPSNSIQSADLINTMTGLNYLAKYLEQDDETQHPMLQFSLFASPHSSFLLERTVFPNHQDPAFVDIESNHSQLTIAQQQSLGIQQPSSSQQSHSPLSKETTLPHSQSTVYTSFGYSYTLRMFDPSQLSLSMSPFLPPTPSKTSQSSSPTTPNVDQITVNTLYSSLSFEHLIHQLLIDIKISLADNYSLLSSLNLHLNDPSKALGHLTHSLIIARRLGMEKLYLQQLLQVFELTLLQLQQNSLVSSFPPQLQTNSTGRRTTGTKGSSKSTSNNDDGDNNAAVVRYERLYTIMLRTLYTICTIYNIPNQYLYLPNGKNDFTIIDDDNLDNEIASSFEENSPLKQFNQYLLLIQFTRSIVSFFSLDDEHRNYNGHFFGQFVMDSNKVETTKHSIIVPIFIYDLHKFSYLTTISCFCLLKQLLPIDGAKLIKNSYVCNFEPSVIEKGRAVKKTTKKTSTNASTDPLQNIITSQNDLEIWIDRFFTSNSVNYATLSHGESIDFSAILTQHFSQHENIPALYFYGHFGVDIFHQSQFSHYSSRLYDLERLFNLQHLFTPSINPTTNDKITQTKASSNQTKLPAHDAEPVNTMLKFIQYLKQPHTHKLNSALWLSQLLHGQNQTKNTDNNTNHNAALSADILNTNSINSYSPFTFSTLSLLAKQFALTSKNTYSHDCTKNEMTTNDGTVITPPLLISMLHMLSLNQSFRIQKDLYLVDNLVKNDKNDNTSNNNPNSSHTKSLVSLGPNIFHDLAKLIGISGVNNANTQQNFKSFFSVIPDWLQVAALSIQHDAIGSSSYVTHKSEISQQPDDNDQGNQGDGEKLNVINQLQNEFLSISVIAPSSGPSSSVQTQRPIYTLSLPLLSIFDSELVSNSNPTSTLPRCPESIWSNVQHVWSLLHEINTLHNQNTSYLSPIKSADSPEQSARSLILPHKYAAKIWWEHSYRIEYAMLSFLVFFERIVFGPFSGILRPPISCTSSRIITNHYIRDFVGMFNGIFASPMITIIQNAKKKNSAIVDNSNTKGVKASKSNNKESTNGLQAVGENGTHELNHEQIALTNAVINTILFSPLYKESGGLSWSYLPQSPSQLPNSTSKLNKTTKSTKIIDVASNRSNLSGPGTDYHPAPGPFSVVSALLYIMGLITTPFVTLRHVTALLRYLQEKQNQAQESGLLQFLYQQMEESGEMDQDYFDYMNNVHVSDNGVTSGSGKTGKGKSSKKATVTATTTTPLQFDFFDILNSTSHPILPIDPYSSKYPCGTFLNEESDQEWHEYLFTQKQEIKFLQIFTSPSSLLIPTPGHIDHSGNRDGNVVWNAYCFDYLQSNHFLTNLISTTSNPSTNAVSHIMSQYNIEPVMTDQQFGVFLSTSISVPVISDTLIDKSITTLITSIQANSHHHNSNESNHGTSSSSSSSPLVSTVCNTLGQQYAPIFDSIGAMSNQFDPSSSQNLTITSGNISLIDKIYVFLTSFRIMVSTLQYLYMSPSLTCSMDTMIGTKPLSLLLSKDMIKIPFESLPILRWCDLSLSTPISPLGAYGTGINSDAGPENGSDNNNTDVKFMMNDITGQLAVQQPLEDTTLDLYSLVLEHQHYQTNMSGSPVKKTRKITGVKSTVKSTAKKSTRKSPATAAANAAIDPAIHVDSDLDRDNDHDDDGLIGIDDELNFDDDNHDDDDDEQVDPENEQKSTRSSKAMALNPEITNPTSQASTRHYRFRSRCIIKSQRTTRALSLHHLYLCYYHLSQKQSSLLALLDTNSGNGTNGTDDNNNNNDKQPQQSTTMVQLTPPEWDSVYQSIGTICDPRQTVFQLDPSNDLPKTQEKFKYFFQKKLRLKGEASKLINPATLYKAFEHCHMFIYSGHNNGLQYYKLTELTSKLTNNITSSSTNSHTQGHSNGIDMNKIVSIAWLLGCSSVKVDVPMLMNDNDNGYNNIHKILHNSHENSPTTMANQIITLNNAMRNRLMTYSPSHNDGMIKSSHCSTTNQLMFEPTGTILAYITAGIPCIVGNLWNVLDQDIDKQTRIICEQIYNEKYQQLSPSAPTSTSKDSTQLTLSQAVLSKINVCGHQYPTFINNNIKNNGTVALNTDDADVDDDVDNSVVRFANAQCDDGNPTTIIHSCDVSSLVITSRQGCLLPYINGASMVIYGAHVRTDKPTKMR